MDYRRSATIECEWPNSLEEAFSRHPVSGELDLSDLCKVLSYVDAESVCFALTRC